MPGHGRGRHGLDARHEGDRGAFTFAGTTNRRRSRANGIPGRAPRGNRRLPPARRVLIVSPGQCCFSFMVIGRKERWDEEHIGLHA